jgi:signal transduction histidine kinase
MSISEVTEPFYRVDKARSRAHGGAGLGLALCKQIATAHGADLTIESVNHVESVSSCESIGSVESIGSGGTKIKITFTGS